MSFLFVHDHLRDTSRTVTARVVVVVVDAGEIGSSAQACVRHGFDVTCMLVLCAPGLQVVY